MCGRRVSAPPPQKRDLDDGWGTGRGNRREYQGIFPMANGLRAGKVPALHGGAHATATTNRTAEERTPGPWDDGRRTGRTQDERTCSVTTDPVVNVNPAGMARRNPASQLCHAWKTARSSSGSSERSHSQTPALRTSCTVPRPRRGGRERIKWRLAACAANKTAIAVSHSNVAAPTRLQDLRRIAATEGDQPGRPDDRQQSRQPRLPRRKSASDRPAHTRGDGGKHDPRISQQSHSGPGCRAGVSGGQHAKLIPARPSSVPAEEKDPTAGEQAKIRIRKSKPSLR